MDLGDYVAYIFFKYDESGVKKAKQGLKEVDKEASDLEKTLGKVFKAFTAGHVAVSTMNYIKKGFVEATAEARKFEFALLDIKKVHPEINLSVARKEIMEVAKVAPGKNISDDITMAYKRAIQEFNDPKMISDVLKMSEKQSIAYDMSVDKTLKTLGILDTNFMKNKQNATVDERLSFLHNVGNKVAFSHHNFGNASVEDILFALQKGSGILTTSGQTEDLGIAVTTLLINSGARAEQAGNVFKRFYNRLTKGVDEQGRRITGSDRFFEAIGINKKDLENTMKVNGDDAFLTVLSAMNKYLNRFEEGQKAYQKQKSGGQLTELEKEQLKFFRQNTTLNKILTPFAGMYVVEDIAKLARDYKNLQKLYNVMRGVSDNYDGRKFHDKYYENAYNIKMASTQKMMEASDTAKQIAYINIGEEFLPMMRGFYALKKSFYEGLGENFKTPTKEEMDSLIEFANMTGKVLSTIATVLLKIPTKLLQGFNINTNPEAMNAFINNNIKDSQVFADKWATRINDFFGIEQPQKERAMTSFYQPSRDFNDFIGRIQNNNSTINSGGNKNINVNINQNNEFNGTNSENMTQITNEILSALETQIKQS